MPSARSRCSSPPVPSTRRRTRPRSASSTASAGACRGPWLPSRIGALSMIGLPPAAGFVSKWYIVSGAIAQAQWFALAVILLSTLLNAGYFLPILHRAFFRPLSAEARRPSAWRGAAADGRRAECHGSRHAGACSFSRMCRWRSPGHWWLRHELRASTGSTSRTTSSCCGVVFCRCWRLPSLPNSLCACTRISRSRACSVFTPLYGFVACALMIVVAKGLGLFLKRPDSFYAEDGRDE